MPDKGTGRSTPSLERPKEFGSCNKAAPIGNNHLLEQTFWDSTGTICQLACYTCYDRKPGIKNILTNRPTCGLFPKQNICDPDQEEPAL